MKDWRGNSYVGYAPLDMRCGWPGCKAVAVRLPCNAERDANRTHHHGGIHRLDDGPGFFFCEPHGLVILAENERIINGRHSAS